MTIQKYLYLVVTYLIGKLDYSTYLAIAGSDISSGYYWGLAQLDGFRRGRVRGVLAVKAVRQNYSGSMETSRLMEVFRRMTNDCIRVGLVNNVASLRRLSLLCYNQLSQYDSPSYYKLCAISRAAEYSPLGASLSREDSTRRLPTL